MYINICILRIEPTCVTLRARSETVSLLALSVTQVGSILRMQCRDSVGITEQRVQKRVQVPVYRQSASKITCIVQELCESRGGRPGLSVLTSLLVSVDVKLF